MNPSIIVHERSLLSIAAPMPSLFTADEPGHRFAWISENSKYTGWFNQKKPQILFVHGKTHVRDAAEYIFFDLDRTRSQHRNEIVLYFTFNRWDLRRDSVEDMLTCFQVQIIGHFPSLAGFVTSQFRQMGEDRSWYNSDLVNWFEYYRLRGEFDGISCVIDRFDECDEDSRATFLKLFAFIARVHERPWRVVVTSHEQGILLNELSQCATLDLERDAPPNPETIDNLSPETRAIVKRRPELRGYEDAIEKEITSLSSLKPIVRDLIREYMSAQEAWPANQSIKSTFGCPVTETATPEAILNEIINRVPGSDSHIATQALSWILYSTRPATIWEIADVIFVNSPKDRGSVFPTREYVDLILAKITKCLAGIVIVEQHELHIRTIGLRQILLSQEGAGGAALHPWEKFAQSVHFDIAETCIKYLVQPQVQERLEKLYKPHGDLKYSEMKLPTHCDRTSLCDYACQFWTYHLVRVPVDQNPASLLDLFLKSDVVDIWMLAYWAASNPIKRSSEPLKSIYPILAGDGLAEMAEPWCDRDNNMTRHEKLSMGLIEAYLWGSSKAVGYLLPLVDHDSKTLQDCLIAAGSRGIEGQWMDLISHIENAHGKSFDWPELLVTRATWLGLDRVVSKLLSLGCRIETDKSSTQMPSPLLLVAWTGSTEVTKALLNAEHRADVCATGEEGRTGLHLAASFGHPEVAKLLKEAGADVNGRDKKGLTPVYLACLWGNYGVVEALCSLGADPNIGDTDDASPDETWYPLLVAAEEGYYECARALLKGGADPNVVGAGGTPLRHAVTNGLPELCRLLLRNGADPNNAGIEPPILYQAVASHEPSNRLEIVRLLVENNARINVAHTNGTTALSWACWNDDDQKAQIAVIECLLDHGADVNRADRRGITPLHVAVRRHNVALVRLLLERGADINGGTSSIGQRTPLSSAAASEDITRLLLDNGADPNRQARPGENSALVWAVMARQIGVARMLLEHGANPDAALAAAEVSPSGRRDDSVWTAMALAAAWNLPDMIRLLGDAGANVDHGLRSNGRSVVHVAAAAEEATLAAILEFRPKLDVRDEDGDTPLHVTAGRGPEHLSESKLLVRAHADINLVNSRGLSPLARAVQEGDAITARFLINKGASVNIASPSHGGPLHLACRDRRLDLTRILLAAGADVNLSVPGTAGTPLQSALLSTMANTRDPDGEDIDNAATTAAELVLFLLEDAKADPSSPGGRFGSAVAVAAWKASAAILDLLLDQGACATTGDSMGRTAVHLAALRRLRAISDGHKDDDDDDDYDHIDLVLGAGGDVACQDKAGRSVLHWAAQGEGGARMLDKLLKALRGGGSRGQDEAAVDKRDAGGWTPLCWAARAGRAEAVRELLQQGADGRVSVHVRGKEEGELGTPLDIARYHSAGDAVVALLSAAEEDGPDVEAAPGKGEDGEGVGADGVTGKEQQIKRVHTATGRRPNSWGDECCDYCLLVRVHFPSNVSAVGLTDKLEGDRRL